MKMGGFDMMALMNSASQGMAKPKYEAKTLPIDAIITNPANHYSMARIDELADSILMAGRVLQNIVVKAADADGRYMIISGHRRHLACQKLVAEGHAEFREIAALVENEADECMRELMLIYTNSTARELTDAEKMRQAQRATDILKQIKAEGKLQAPLRETVARMLGTASGQIARYAAIANNLTNKDLQEAFEEERIGVSTAYESSRLSDEGQAEIADKLHAAGTVTLRDVEEVKRREQEHTPAADAPPPATPPCAETQTANPCTPPQEPENPADFPYATDSPKAYAIMAVYGELKALMESYRGAAQRAIAIAEDGKGAANLSAAAEYVQTLMEIVEQEMADIAPEEG
ncbi:ParB N-terminal domain-containing protein [uncultured Selenomonas sp.]|uniref:ParB/RepB/Spo0J family partition protein n=1 Tax=uncultured Selenomonas sp. TaxID=159275 RepID=UPI0028E8BD66|nr:ParB N-terminal domain-containing protein [uncultured Selenomonas sp.]